jgi:hypothetical protein
VCPGRLTEPAALYREEGRNFAVGDRTAALKNERGLKMKNGSLGTLRKHREDRLARVALGDCGAVLDLNCYRQHHHAYAVTIPMRRRRSTQSSSPTCDPRRISRSRGKPGEQAAEDAYERTSYYEPNAAVTHA